MLITQRYMYSDHYLQCMYLKYHSSKTCTTCISSTAKKNMQYRETPLLLKSLPDLDTNASVNDDCLDCEHDKLYHLHFLHSRLKLFVIQIRSKGLTEQTKYLAGYSGQGFIDFLTSDINTLSTEVTILYIRCNVWVEL